MRLLIIEDDHATAKSIELAVASEGIVCDTSTLGEEGYELARLYDYDIIILDMMLPDINGFEVLRRLRMNNVTTPVLILSGLTSTDHKVKGLGIGADDYVTKPFNNTEILERVRAIVRRSKGHSQSVIRLGKFEIDVQKRTVFIDGKKVNLTNKEYSVLELMVLRKGNPIKKETFLNHLYGGIDEPELKIVDVFICKLRKKLMEASGGINYIETLWGRGYMVVDPDEEKKEEAS